MWPSRAKSCGETLKLKLAQAIDILTKVQGGEFKPHGGQNAH